MAGSTHIDTDECAELRRARKRGVSPPTLADERGYSAAAVRWHVYGRCGHDTFVDEPAATDAAQGL